MRTIFISAGHSSKVGRDNGASGNGFIEGVLAVEFRDLLVVELKKLGVTPVIDSNDSILVQSIAFFKNLTSEKSILFDIHWNAATPQATGTEVFIPNTATSFEKELASEITKTTASVLKIKDRGVKTEGMSARKTLGWMRLKGENILSEICFISNKSDMQSYQTNKKELAKKIAEVLFKYAKK